MFQCPRNPTHLRLDSCSQFHQMFPILSNSSHEKLPQSPTPHPIWVPALSTSPELSLSTPTLAPHLHAQFSTPNLSRCLSASPKRNQMYLTASKFSHRKMSKMFSLYPVCFLQSSRLQIPSVGQAVPHPHYLNLPLTSALCTLARKFSGFLSL